MRPDDGLWALMTLEEVIAVQHRLGLTDVHVVYLGPENFQLAHTEMERDMKMGRMFDLKDCPVHKWLNGLGSPPAIGLFVIRPHEVGAISVANNAPWDIQPLGSNGGRHS